MKLNCNKRNIAFTQRVWVTFCFLLFSIHSKSQNPSITDDNERKVDYFERIYFSGKNKADINAFYLATIQQLDGKLLSPAAAKQYVLLIALKDEVFIAENACDALDIIAVGIYSIDASSAINQGIKAPNEKVKKKTFSDVSSVLTSNVDSASKAYQYAAKAGEGRKIATGVREVFRGFFPKKDNPCKHVNPKEIEIGLHPVNTTVINNKDTIGSATELNTINTKITIKNIKYNQFSILVSRIEKITGIIDVNSDNYTNNIAILELKHNLKIKEILDKILTLNKEFKIVVESATPDGILLNLK